MLIPFLINRLGLEGYGLVNFVLAFTFFFQVVNEFGFDLSNVPHVVKNRNNPVQLSFITSAIVFNRLGIYVLTSVVYFVIVAIIPSFRENFLTYLLGNIRILALAVTPIWLFRSLEDMKTLTRVAVPVKIITLLPIFITVKNQSDVNWTMFFFMIECVSSVIVSYIIIKRLYDIRIVRVKFADMKYYIRESVPYFTSYLLMRVYQNGNTVILKFVGGDAIVGLYTAAERLHNAYTGFVSPVLIQVFYPYFTRIKDFVKINKIVLLMVFANAIMVGLIYLFAPYLIDKFIKDSPDTILKYFNIFLIGILVDIPNNILGYSYLGVLGLVNKVNVSSIWAAGAYVVGAIILFITDSITVGSLIWLLITVQFISMLIRLYFIYISKNHSGFTDGSTNISKD